MGCEVLLRDLGGQRRWHIYPHLRRGRFSEQYFFPGYSHIFDGTGASDLLEIDGATSSMHVFTGGTAPSLQLALEEVEVIGNSGCGWVFFNVPSSSDTNIAPALRPQCRV
jgi:hypothetical protein